MRPIPNIPWPHIFAEGVIIVVSILLAFWIDATWDERQALEEEQAILSTLLTELEEFQAARQGYDDYMLAIRESLRRLLEFGREPNTAISNDQLDAWLADTTWNARGLIHAMPVLDSLMNGGNLYRISNNDLRVLVSKLHQYIEFERSDASREQEFVDNQYNPYLNFHASVNQIWSADDGEPGLPPELRSETVAFPFSIESQVPTTKISHHDLVANIEFQNLLIQRIGLVTNLIEFGPGSNIDDALSTTIVAVKQELEK